MAFTSVPGRMMPGSLPPISSVRRARLPAELFTISRPVLVDPVNMTLSMSGCAAIASPTSRPPETTVSTPSGRWRFMSSATASTLRGCTRRAC